MVISVMLVVLAVMRTMLKDYGLNMVKKLAMIWLFW